MVRKLKVCPKCGARAIRIIYGYLTPNTKLTKYEIPGGCCIDEDSPDFQCKECGFEWKETK